MKKIKTIESEAYKNSLTVSKTLLLNSLMITVEPNFPNVNYKFYIRANNSWELLRTISSGAVIDLAKDLKNIVEFMNATIIKK